MYMTTRIRRRKNNKRRRTKKYVGRGNTTTLNADVIIKELLLDNVNNRFVERPDSIQDYTIHPGNKDNIIRYINTISNIKEGVVSNPVLNPVLSKGYERILRLKQFIEYMNNKDLPDNIKAVLISQYIIINQVFGDGNHRAGLSILRKHSTYVEKDIQKIMAITERIHKYDGDLKSKNFWMYNPDFSEHMPDMSKIDEMIYTR